MLQIRRLLIRLPACLLLLVTPAWTQTTVAEVEQCIARNLPERSARLEFEIQAEDREGGVERTVATLLWRRDGSGGSRALLRIREPEEMRGTSVLMVLEEERDPRVFVYLPEVEKVRRLRKGRLRGALLGTDFSFEDFERLQGHPGRTRLVLREEPVELDGRSTWALDAFPHPDEGSAYRRVTTYVDTRSCLPLRLEFEDHQGRLRKRLSTDPVTIRTEGERFVPSVYRMEDLRDGTQTQVWVALFEVEAELAAEQLSKEALATAASGL